MDELNPQTGSTGKPIKMTKIKFCVYYLVFCAAIFTFWQLLGGICVEYNKLGYALGHSETYLVWSWIMLAVWVIGSFVFLIVAEAKEN